MQKIMPNFFLVICGPTGVGKSDLSLELGKKLPIEIVNCDVGQFYQPVAIGTAKPDWQNDSVPHHFFDLLSEPRNLSVAEYRNLLIPLMHKIRARGNLPVLVGGSLFYLKSLFFPPVQQRGDQKIEEAMVSEFIARAAIDQFSSDQLWDKLYALDPIRAQMLEKNDLYRIARALVIWEKSGILPSALAPKFRSLGDFHITFVTRDRKELYNRINCRVENMIQQGWIDEAAGLSPEWENFLQIKKLIGYPEILSCLEQETIQECKKNTVLVERIQKKTRNYAKRQLTFWRTFQEQLNNAVFDYSAAHGPLQGTCQELNLTLSSIDLYLKHMFQLFDMRG
jgi:tRNA dimethylallyltransferase